MRSDSESPASDGPSPEGQAVRINNLHMGPRQRKEILLPRVTRLALEGHTGQAIAHEVGLPKRTVNHWLQELRQEWISKAADGAAEMLAVGLARLDAVYREAMEAWHDSQREVQVRLVEESELLGDKGCSKSKKSSLRTRLQGRNAAYLARATAAARATCQLMGRAAPRSEAAGRGPVPLVVLTNDDLKRMTDDELRALVARSRIAIEALNAGEGSPRARNKRLTAANSPATELVPLESLAQVNQSLPILAPLPIAEQPRH